MSKPRALAELHDVLLVDLDGTLVLAGQPVPHAAASLATAAAMGARLMIVTNNASRSPRSVADSLSGLGFSVTDADVVNSAQAAAAMLAGDHPAGARVLAVGAQALFDAVSAAGLTPVRTAGEEPVAVVQGYSPDTDWHDLAEACIAIRAGADWVATNTDPTLPTDRGLLPGNGSMVAALVTATGVNPRVAGKPARALLDDAVRRTGARRPLVVGDRLDTDIAAAVAAGIQSLFVLTGVSTAADLMAAPAGIRPSSVAADLRGLVDPAACWTLTADDPDAAGSGWHATVSDGHLELRSGGGDAGGPVAGLAALTVQAWRTGLSAVRAGDAAAEHALTQLGLI